MICLTASGPPVEAPNNIKSNALGEENSLKSNKPSEWLVAKDLTSSKSCFLKNSLVFALSTSWKMTRSSSSLISCFISSRLFPEWKTIICFISLFLKNSFRSLKFSKFFEISIKQKSILKLSNLLLFIEEATLHLGKHSSAKNSWA